MDTTATVEGKAKTRNGVKRLIFVIISILIEVLFVLSIIIKFNEHAEWISIATRVLALLLVLVIYGGGDNKSASIKMPWIIDPAAGGCGKDSGESTQYFCRNSDMTVI